MKLSQIQNREQIGDFLQEHFNGGNGLEVGVQYGWSLYEIATRWSKRHDLFGVDVWANTPGYIDACNTLNEIQNRTYFEASLRLGSAATLIKMDSLDAAKEFARRGMKFVFVYIDANHSYAATSQDISAYWPLVEEGGILAGHDYMDCQTAQGDYGVKSAVLDFFKPRAGELEEKIVITKDNPPSWIARKKKQT